MAAGAIKFLSESGLQVPRDISVIGYDNNDICQGIVPSLTTVDHRLEELGRCLGQGLLGLIEGADTEVRKSIMPVLVERQSHGSPTNRCMANQVCDGNFDKTKLPDPLILDFYFTLRDDKIVRLIIIFNRPVE